MTNYACALVVQVLKQWEIEKGTAKKLFLALTEDETLVDELNSPKLYSYLDLAEALSLLASDQEVSLITTTGTRREVKINHKKTLLSLIMEWLDYDFFHQDQADDEGEIIDNTGLPFDPEREDELQERIQFLIDESCQYQELFKALAGRNRSGGWVPLLGYLAKRLNSILVEDKVVFKNESERFTLIFDLILIFHDRAEDTNNKKSKAVKNWMGAYDKLPQNIKTKAKELLDGEKVPPEGLKGMGSFYTTEFDFLWNNNE